MSAIASWFGSGAGLIVLGVAWVLQRHLEHLPDKAHPWGMRLVIVLMFMGSAAVAITEAGAWIEDLLRWAMHGLGGIGTAIAVVGAVLMIAKVFFGLWRRPTDAVVTIAAFLPLVLGIFVAGHLHALYEQTSTPSRSETNQISTWLKG
jgi:hypothetical protein